MTVAMEATAVIRESPQKIGKQAKIINCALSQKIYEMRIFCHSGSPANVGLPILMVALFVNSSSHIAT
ncbi:hypothetical protein Y032_0242g3450 [Ancylostoma ceylanicum]|nr:hypothetical protein Y032_0242g3450 [Ancylostoma ceylanicum]